MSRHFLGLDAGSSVTKAALFDREGRLVGNASRRVTQRRPHPGWCELDPEEAWKAAASVIREVLATTGVAPSEIGGLGISAAMVGAWVVDEKGRALRPGILWEDSRAQPLIEELAAADPQFFSTIFRSSGSALQQGCTLPVMAWLAHHEPATLAKAAHLFGYKDFLRMRLTARAGTDRSEAAVAPGSAAARGRSPAMLELFGLGDHAHLLPEPSDSETCFDGISPRAAAETGLAAGTPVAVGAGDVGCTVIGAGGLEPGTATAVLGTTCMVGMCHDRPVFEPPDIGLLFTLPGGVWYRAMVNVAGTLNLDWALATLAPELLEAPDSFDRLTDTVRAVPPGANGVTFLPYLSESGIIAPVVDASARAGFFGLTPRHTRADMLRAVYEGVAFAMRDLIEAMDAAPARLLLTGGGARSDLWVSLIASVLEREVEVPAGREFGARGAALLAATAAGDYEGVREASAAAGRGEARVFSPDPAPRAALRVALGRYRDRRDRLVGGATA